MVDICGIKLLDSEGNDFAVCLLAVGHDGPHETVMPDPDVFEPRTKGYRVTWEPVDLDDEMIQRWASNGKIGGTLP